MLLKRAVLKNYFSQQKSVVKPTVASFADERKQKNRKFEPKFEPIIDKKI